MPKLHQSTSPEHGGMYRVGVLLPIGGGHTPSLLQLLSPKEQRVFENQSHATGTEKRCGSGICALPFSAYA